MSAPDLEPISWRALEALADVVRGITQANGYHTDIGAGPVILDDEQIDADAPDQSAVFIDATEILVESSGRGMVNNGMDITIEFVVPRTAANRNPKLLVHRGCADLVRALSFKTSGRDTTLPAGFRSFEVTGARLDGITEEDTGDAVVIAQVTARAGLTDLKLPA